MSLVEKYVSPGSAVEDVLHARGQRDGIAAGVALHALGLAGRAAGVEGVADVGRVEPGAWHGVSQMLCAQRRPVVVAAFGAAASAPGRGRPATRLAACAPTARIASSSSGLYAITLPPRDTRVGTDDDLRLRILDARRQRSARKAAEHDAVDRADARAGQHREHGLRDHRHVDQHAVALADPEAMQAAAMRWTSTCSSRKV